VPDYNTTSRQRWPSAEEVARALGGTPKTGRGYMCHCPGSGHKRGDKNASLSVDIGRDGRLLLHCFAGCSFGEVCERLAAMHLLPRFEWAVSAHRRPRR
jgi:hypothetical protein